MMGPIIQPPARTISHIRQFHLAVMLNTHDTQARVLN